MILDGALATQLQRRGASLRDPLWSARVLLEQPELIRAVHAEYFEAGADVAITASYQASFEGFARRGIDAAGATQLLRNSVALAIAARDEFWRDESLHGSRLRPLVAASIGPYGAILADGSEYRGHYGLSEAQLMDFHRPRLRVLAASGADLLACETLPSLGEALALARLLQEFPETTAWMSFCCQDGERTCEGQPMAECAEGLAGFPQVISIGINCTPPQYAGSLLTSLRAHCDKPLLAYPNSGETYDELTKQWHGCPDSTPLAQQALGWHSSGASLIGGCCRTTPEDIRQLRLALAP
jgi:homocysteine S-methyltransferase